MHDLNPHRNTSVRSRPIQKVSDSITQDIDDDLAVEEPLEIRLDFEGISGERVQKSISITMRTPGFDFELASGFLFTEGVIEDSSDIESIRHCGPKIASLGHSNIVKVSLRKSLVMDLKHLDRHFFVNSSCGICGKSSIEALKTKNRFSADQNKPEIQVSKASLYQMPMALRESQKLFDSTGGMHASALFDREAKLIYSREDVGRHNALDKVIGRAVLHGELPLREHILMLSGRISFELVQKASMAGIQIVAAIGAPSSLAIEIAEEMGITLVGFSRDRHFNIYAGASRIL